MPSKNNGLFNISHNVIEDEHWKLSRVLNTEDFACLNSFSCGEDKNDEFIRDNALSHKEQLIAETYVLKSKEDNNDNSVAFISFCNDAIPLTHLQETSQEAITSRKRYPNMPAVKIARLGVSCALQRKNLGTYIINMAKVFFTTDNRTGCRFLTVDALNNPNVIKFYTQNDFQVLKKQKNNKKTVIMYLDLKRLE
jgi:hypothetical protein